MYQPGLMATLVLEPTQKVDELELEFRRCGLSALDAKVLSRAVWFAVIGDIVSAQKALEEHFHEDDVVFFLSKMCGKHH